MIRRSIRGLLWVLGAGLASQFIFLVVVIGFGESPHFVRELPVRARTGWPSATFGKLREPDAYSILYAVDHAALARRWNMQSGVYESIYTSNGVLVDVLGDHVRRHTLGYPLQAFSGLDWHVEHARPQEERAWLVERPDWLGGTGHVFETIPIRPLWGGIAVNTLCFGVPLFAGAHLVRFSRRLVRCRRNVCLDCGYSLVGSERRVCPECGGRTNRNP